MSHPKKKLPLCIHFSSLVNVQLTSAVYTNVTLDSGADPNKREGFDIGRQPSWHNNIQHVDKHLEIM